MQFSKPHTLAEIAAILNCKFIGNSAFLIKGMNEIHRIKEGEIVFVDHPKYYDKALQSAASVILINKEVPCPEGKALLISSDPFRDFNTLANHFKPFIASNTSIAPTARIGKDTQIQPNVFIGNHVTIGKNCIIHSNVSIYDHTQIGDHVVIHAGTVIGSDAFYYKNRQTHHDQLLSSGFVKINNNVHIGALCTIDRGVSDVTLIDEDTKLDNQVHVGHDTQIGKRCIIASQVGIAGCTNVEDHVTLWGQVGITSGITIGEKAVISAQSGVSKSLEGHASYFGTPAGEFRKKYKELAAIREIPKLKEQLEKLEKSL